MSLITQVLEFYGFENVPQSGGWRPVKCAFHGDRHASASVNPDLGGYRCHTCDISGDVYKLVMEQEGIEGFAEAKRRVADITGTDVRDLPGQDDIRGLGIPILSGPGRQRNRVLSPRRGGSRW